MSVIINSISYESHLASRNLVGQIYGLFSSENASESESASMYKLAQPELQRSLYHPAITGHGSQNSLSTR